ncbi:hypothetical protein LOTGIDRAFT_121864 [Lottia gigantea]|uniref:protein-ribulosamine 3-kinase n=1 Tax=Lottia gigantea TaxID=225164 RepID=V3ZK19_LOTGI|nr:hypothetical protein LOTGIDRAFT_121864 [Lottia gigantea]ESO91643.1 hypothetical protein LOTGIDRAFT_121864 [Lottia gigantea]
MEELLKKELKTSKLESLGSCSGGYINIAQAFNTDYGKIFVKTNEKPQAGLMFQGEFKSLEAINKTGTVKTPKPYKVIDNPAGGSIFVMEYLDLRGKVSTSSAQLGRQLASLHLYNTQLKEQKEKIESFVGKQETVNYVDQFGFEVPTCCGYLPQSNSWSSDWLNFYCGKIEAQIDSIDRREYNMIYRKIRDLWNTLLPGIPKLFTGLEIRPALLHGDLHFGNASESLHGPVIYDPASFYGHAEYDLAIAHIYGKFEPEFFQAYHGVIPEADGFQNRLELYKIFHYINHWNHFHRQYPGRTIDILHSLIKATR